MDKREEIIKQGREIVFFESKINKYAFVHRRILQVSCILQQGMTRDTPKISGP